MTHRIFNLHGRMWGPQLLYSNSWLQHACRIQFSDQGLTLGPLHWECRILAIGPPGKSLFGLMKLCVILGRALWARRQGTWDLIWSQPGHWSSLASFPIYKLRRREQEEAAACPLSQQTADISSPPFGRPDSTLDRHAWGRAGRNTHTGSLGTTISVNLF